MRFDDHELGRGRLAQEADREVGRPVRMGARRKTAAQLGLWVLSGASAFDSDGVLTNPRAVIREIAAQPIGRFLVAAYDPRLEAEIGVVADPDVEFVRARKPGPDPMAGSWILAYLFFVLSENDDFTHFWSGTPLEDWLMFGFPRRPSRALVSAQFARLEDHSRYLAAARRLLIGLAKEAYPQTGRLVSADATPWVSPARLDHCCPDPSVCHALGPIAKEVRTSSEAMHEDRQREVDETEEVDPFPESARGRQGRETFESATGRLFEFRYFLIKKHRFRTLDLSSGLRVYGKRSWFGGLTEVMTDFLWGLALELEVFPADVQEADHLPPLLANATEALGEAPYLLSVDRAYTTRNGFKFATRRGVTLVGTPRGLEPRRRLSYRTDLFDEWGVPRCQGCGGEGDVLSAGRGLIWVGGQPVIRFGCRVPRTSRCRSLQHLPCSADYRFVLPIPQISVIYQAAAHYHHNREGTHDQQRDRYNTSGKDRSSSLTRNGVGAQQLRSEAALFLDWFRALLRNGVLEATTLDITRNASRPQLRSAVQDRRSGLIVAPGMGDTAIRRLQRDRQASGADVPYGAHWLKARDAILRRRRERR
jgi:hypothetical protein